MDFKIDWEEAKDFAIAIVYIAFIFGFTLSDPAHVIYAFPVYLLITVISFLPHELAHKYAAIKYGCKAYFQIWKEGMLFSFLMLPLGIKLIVPGAVMIHPYKYARWKFPTKRLTMKEYAIISLVGPLANILIGFVLFWFDFWFAKSLAMLNFWLAFFNLLPVPPLDGSKIIYWNFSVWLVMILIPFAFLFII